MHWKNSYAIQMTLLLWMLICQILPAKASFVGNELFAYEHIGFADGLTSQRVYSLVEGKCGEIWISTKSGLARFNGRTLVNYTLDTGQPYSDAGGRVIRMVATPSKKLLAYDNKGNIFAYHSGIDRFTPEEESFSARFMELNRQLNGLILNYVMEDQEGVMWFATSQGLFVVHPDKPDEMAWWNQTDYLNGVISCGEEMVAYGNAGAYVFNRQTGEPKHLLTAHNIQSAYFDPQQQTLWLGTFHDGVCLVDVITWQQKETALPSLLPSLPVRAIERLDDSTLLLGIDGAGVYAAYHDGSRSYPLFGQENATGEILHGNGIYAILRDSRGNIWIGSYTGGVDVAYPTGRLVDIIEHKSGVNQSLMNNGVNDILPWGDQWVFATDCGVSFFDLQTNRWLHTLQGKVVLTLCSDGERLLAGTYGDGVYRIDSYGRAEQAYSQQQGTLATNYIFSIAHDTQGGLWIGCLDGALCYFSNQGMKRYPIETVQCLTPVPGGAMAVGTANGFYLVSPERDEVTHHFSSDEFEGEDVNNFVKSLLFTSPDSVWIATDGGGIYAYQLSTRCATHYTQVNGLPSNSVAAITFDNMGRIVASTDDGLGVLYPSTGDAIDINFIPGVEREFNRMAVANLPDGRLMFGSNQGAVVIDPQLVKPLDYNAELRFSGVRIKADLNDNQRCELFQALRRGSLHLSHAHNSLEILFESICFRYRSDLLYQYQLKGFNADWSVPSEQSAVTFDNLPAGSYTLQVRAVSRNSGRIIDSSQLQITIDEPWWNSLYAWLVYSMLFLLFVALALRNYQGRLERRSFNEKIDFFINAAHEIRTPLSLVLEPLSTMAADSELSERSRRYLEIARNNGGKLQTLISELLDFQKADEKAHAIHPVPVQVKTMLQTECDRFDLMAKDKGVSLTVECNEELMVSMDIALSGKLLDNLISNAIKYTPKGGAITLKAWSEGKQVKIEVRDTGIGIPKGDQKMIFKSFFRAENAMKTQETGSGIGLMLARRIVMLHHGKLTFQSEEGQGTSFLVTLDRLERPLSEVVSVHGKVDEKEACSKEDERDVLLFVDDNADMRHYFTMAFGEDFRVVTAEEAYQALDFLKEHECDLVVSDLVMPGLRGDELCRRIKQNLDTSWMPVVLLTAVSEKELVLEGLQTGADDYLTKPFDTEILKEKIRSILSNRRRMSDYYRQRVERLVNVEPLATLEETLPQEPEESSESSLFIDKVTHKVMEHMDDPAFSIDALCSEMAMSRTLLYGKLKTLTAQTPQDFIRTIRLQRAASLLSEGTPILEVCTLVGFSNPKHFSTVFKKQFGLPPSKFAEAKQQK